MLIGQHRELKEVLEIMIEKMEDLKMQARAKEDKHNEVAKSMATHPPQRGSVDERPAQRLQIEGEVLELRAEIDWLEAKINEAEEAIEKDPLLAESKVYLDLNDMVRLGVTDPDEDAEEAEEN